MTKHTTLRIAKAHPLEVERQIHAYIIDQDRYPAIVRATEPLPMRLWHYADRAVDAAAWRLTVVIGRLRERA